MASNDASFKRPIGIEGIRLKKGDNFAMYEYRMRSAFIVNNVWPIVNGTEKAPGTREVTTASEQASGEEESGVRTRNQKQGTTTVQTSTTNTVDSTELVRYENRCDLARALIIMTLSDEQLQHLTGLASDHPADMWAKLRQVHRMSAGSRKSTLWRQLLRMQMLPEETIAEYYGRYNAIVLLLNDAGIKEIDAELLIAVFTDSLPKRFRVAVSALEASGENERSIDRVVERLMREEQVLMGYADASGQSFEGEIKKKICHRCNSDKHLVKDCPHPDKRKMATGLRAYSDSFGNVTVL